MRYQVPQFIEVEDKIFGPLTLKQFIYLIAAGGVVLMCVSLMPILLAIAVSIPFVAGALALAFYQVNERPLIVLIEHAFTYLLSNKLYLWKQRPPEKPIEAPIVVTRPNISTNELSPSKLIDLAWSLNIKDRMKVVEPERPERQI